MLNSAELAAFGEQGWLLVEGVVPPDRIAAARAAVPSPPPDVRGPSFTWPQVADPNPYLSTLLDTPAFTMAEALVRPERLGHPRQVQVALNVPPFPHRPGSPHVDGLTPTEPDGRPGTFSMLVGIFLTDQLAEDAGNLWVWPGTHVTAGQWLSENGADALTGVEDYPPIDLPEPVQVCGPAGSVLFAHYLLAHNIGGNVSAVTRECLYFRLLSRRHRQDWRDLVTDPLAEFAPVRRARSST